MGKNVSELQRMLNDVAKADPEQYDYTKECGKLKYLKYLIKQQ